MAAKWKEGDRVQIRDREATPDDAKSGLFYGHFRGLTGAIQKIYPTEEGPSRSSWTACPKPSGSGTRTCRSR